MFIIGIFALVSLILWVVTAVVLSRATPKGRSVRVRGEVMGFREYLERGQTMYSARYRARTPDGREVHGESAMGKSWQSPPVGTQVTLLYCPDDAQCPLVELGFVRFVPTIVVGGFATLLTVFTVVVALMNFTGPPDAAPGVAEPHLHHHHRRHDALGTDP